MSDPTADFFEFVVMPAIQEYLQAEDILTAAVRSGIDSDLCTARQLVLCRGRTAAIELHQFADRVYADEPLWRPSCSSANAVRIWLKENWCKEASFLMDFDILSTVADAFKHAEPNWKKDALFKTDKVVIRPH